MSKKLFIILLTICIIILIAIGVLYFSGWFDRWLQAPAWSPIEKAEQSSSMQGHGANTKKLTRYGKMTLQTDKNSISINENFSVAILINTQNSNIVLASAGIIYNPELLELVEINDETSALSMAVIKEQEKGKIEIIRGEPGDTDYNDKDDGYNGSDGNLVILKFKALKKGNTKIKFDKNKTSMLLDDGKGTEMEVELEDLDINIK